MRGWLNLGISYANLKKYNEAVKSYLQALHLNPNAKHIWNYLRTCLTHLNRLDLVESSANENIVELANLLGYQLQNV